MAVRPSEKVETTVEVADRGHFQPRGNGAVPSLTT